MSDYREIDFSTGQSGDILSSKISIMERRLDAYNNSYIGNKRKISADIIKFIEDKKIKYDNVLDLFSGSSYMSAAFKMMDKRVVSNDIMAFCSISALYLIGNKNITLTYEEKKIITNTSEKLSSIKLENNEISSQEMYCIENYYFNTVKLFGEFSTENIKFALSMYPLLTYILNKCFVGGRQYKGQVFSRYDYRISHVVNKGKEMFVGGDGEYTYRGLKWITPLEIGNDKDHLCYRMDACECLQQIDLSGIDLCYIDPPYGGGQSDYCQMYEFCEKIILGDKYYDESNLTKYNKNFVNKSNYEEHFRNLISLCKEIPILVISYNDNSWGDISEIVDVVKEYRRDVTLEDFKYSYKYRDQKNNSSETKEFVILAK
jgi:adenine-specific DNA methylase